MSKIKLVAMDLDNTLLDSEKQISKHTEEVLKEAIEGTEKHTIFILTLIKKKKSIRVFMILVDFLLDKI